MSGETIPFPASRIARERRKAALPHQPPVILRHQPEPSKTMVVWHAVWNGWVSAITRFWSDGDERRCRLCDRCSAQKGVCLITVNRRIEIEDAPLLSTVGYEESAGAREKAVR